MVSSVWTAESQEMRRPPALEVSRRASNGHGHRVWCETLVEGTSEEQAGEAQCEM